MKLRKGKPFNVEHSELIDGDEGNYDWPVKFDLQGQYVGITQRQSQIGQGWVLLSPEQVRALVEFVTEPQP